MTAIEWTDETWNPVTGCTKVSPGCKFCYAERVTERFGRGKFSEVTLHPDRLDAPLRWRRPRRVFVNSMSDLFHAAVPDEFLDRVFAVMALSPRHTFQVLTKRPDRMRRWFERWPLPNVWLGVSVEDQQRADERIPLLLQTPAAVRFLSVEPLLGPVDVRRYLVGHEEAGIPFSDPPTRTVGGCATWTPPVDWVIVGGESGGPPERQLVVSGAVGATMGGPQLSSSLWAKPEALAWVRSLRDQCVAAGVPFLLKQWGGPTPKAGGRMLDGRTWDEYPK